MHGQAVVLANSYTNAAPAAQAAQAMLQGGRYVIVSDGTSFPTTCQVQMMSLNGSWVSVGSNITAAAVSSGLDLPAGQYRLNLAGVVAATALSVALVRCPQ